jgi:large conductance mechanosensitive channel
LLRAPLDMKPIIETIELPIKKVNPILKEFKTFALRGNVLDLAVGVIIGTAFGKVVDSLVKDVLMPPLSILTGDIDLSNRFINLTRGHYRTLEEARAHNAPVITYGVFLDTVITFTIVAFAIFVMVRLINKIHHKPAPPSAPATKDCPFCLSSIPVGAKKCAHCTSDLNPA